MGLNAPMSLPSLSTTVTDADTQLARDLANASQCPAHDGGCQGLVAEDIVTLIAAHREHACQTLIDEHKQDMEAARRGFVIQQEELVLWMDRAIAAEDAIAAALG